MLRSGTGNGRRWQVGFILALLAAAVLASQIPSAVATGPVAGVAKHKHKPKHKHKHPKPIALAIRYLAGADFSPSPSYVSGGVATYEQYDFCDLKLGFGYRFAFQHPSLLDPDNSIFDNGGGTWQITNATAKKGKLRTATIGYTIKYFQSVDNHSAPGGDPRPPSPGTYSLTAHGPFSATIDGTTLERTADLVYCIAG